MEARPLKDLPINSNFVINFNWECNIPARTVRDTILITYEEENEKHKEEDINDVMDIERTADFMQPSHCTEKPILTLSVPEVDNFYISQIYIVCDCKIVEVFGEHDMYLDTVHGAVLDECDDFRACEFKANLSSKVNKKITVNFLKLLDSVKNHLWIYGIHLTLKPMSQQNLNSSIRFDNVQELLKDTKISDKASKCFKFLRESMNNPQFTSGRTSMSSPMAPNFSLLGNTNPNPNMDRLIIELKQYIDHKFLVLNEFLILRERNLHDKIDLILHYIKSQNTRI